MAERVALAERARGVLMRAVASLTLQDRRILQLRFARGLSVADIAREMGLKQKTLYVRCGQLLKTLRSRLEDDGLVEREVLNVIGRTDF
jgi:RNA polymerase sigma factor (sigma-70 family)